MDSKHVKIDKSQQTEKKNVTPIRGFPCFPQWHCAQLRFTLPQRLTINLCYGLSFLYRVYFVNVISVFPACGIKCFYFF